VGVCWNKREFFMGDGSVLGCGNGGEVGRE
jgi:hypothetical protein